MWTEIKQIIEDHERFLIATHVNPDGDGLGSSCAMIELLLFLGKKVRFVSDGPIPPKFYFLDYHHLFESYNPEKSYKTTEVLIVLDTHRKDRIGSLAKLLSYPHMKAICIDHHVETETFTENTVIDPKACCAGAMVCSLCKSFGFKLNIEAATGIYTSIVCDTGRFSYSSTTQQAHKLANECIKKGVDPDWMYTQLFQHVTLADIKVFANVLQHMETYFNNRVIIQQIFREDYEDPECGALVDIEHNDLEYFHEFNKSIENVECVVLLRELPNHQVRISMRSHSVDNIDKVLHSLGGGGHSKAAGATWKGSIQEAKETILGLLSSAL